MAIEREVQWQARAVLRLAGEEGDGADIGLRGVLPTVKIAQGSLAEMVARAMARPAEHRWRYMIASDVVPYLVSEEIAALAAHPDFPLAEPAG